MGSSVKQPSIKRDAKPSKVGSKGAEESSDDTALVDASLVSQARSGDVNAFRVLVERYEQRARSIALGILGNREDAEDVAQDAFIKAFRSLDSFRGQSSFYTWLYRIVFNLSIDLARKRYRHVESSVGDAAILDSTPAATDETSVHYIGRIPSGEIEFERKELREQIELAMSKLSFEHRAVVLLREVDGLSYSEISDVVGCSKGTVMSRLHHARKKLQKALKEFYPQGQVEHNQGGDQNGHERDLRKRDLQSELKTVGGEYTSLDYDVDGDVDGDDEEEVAADVGRRFEKGNG